MQKSLKVRLIDLGITLVVVIAVMMSVNWFASETSAQTRPMSLTPSPEPPTNTPLPTNTLVPQPTATSTSVPATNVPQPTATSTSVPATNVPQPTATATDVPPPPAATSTSIPAATSTTLPTKEPPPPMTSTSVPATPITDLAIQKTVDKQQVAIGDPVRWTVRIWNAGNSVAQNVVMRDQLPAFFTGLNATATRGDVVLQDQLVTVALDTLAPGESVEIWIDGTISSLDGDLTNTAKVTTSTTEITTSNNTSSSTVGKREPSAPPAAVQRPAPTKTVISEERFQQMPVTADDASLSVWIPLGLLGLAVVLFGLAWRFIYPLLRGVQ